jgi:ABC-type uncharacterized transport system permease subunit
MLGSPDHVALRLRKWRLSTRQTVAVSYAATAVLGASAVAISAVEIAAAVTILGALAAVGVAAAFWLKRIDMSL